MQSEGPIGMLNPSDWLSTAASLPTGFCVVCDRHVLLSPLEDQRWACVHCESGVGSVEMVAEEELSELGYAIVEEPAAGCGTGCGAGGCAVRKPQTTLS
jgi:hypothetical protein